MNTRKYRRVYFILIIAFFILSSSSYAVWDNLSKEQDNVVEVGEGTNLIVSVDVSAPSGKTLVPKGTIVGVNDVDEILLTYNVRLSKTTLEDLNFTVSAEDIKIGGSSIYSDLLNINITTEFDKINNSNVLVSVIVSLNNPNNLQIYQEIIGQSITFNLRFMAGQGI